MYECVARSDHVFYLPVYNLKQKNDNIVETSTNENIGTGSIKEYSAPASTFKKNKC